MKELISVFCENRYLLNLLSGVMALFGALASYLYGTSNRGFLLVLITFVFIDYFSGWAAASSEGKLNSKAGFRGIAKKVMLFLIVATGHLIDVALGGHTNMVRDAAIWFYIGNEILSIIENSGRLGLPVPKAIVKAVEVIKAKEDLSNTKGDTTNENL